MVLLWGIQGTLSYPGLNQDWPHARQVLCPLYYLSGSFSAFLSVMASGYTHHLEHDCNM